MSERTFRAVVASVLVGALVLAIVVTAALLAPPSREPAPVPTITASPLTAPVPTVTPTPVAGPAFKAPTVVSVGLISRGATSGTTLVIEFVEPRHDAIPNAPGSFVVTLTDKAGDGSTVAFVGTPSVGAPGSLGATAVLEAPNVLLVSIVASDPVEVEPITIRGLGIRTSSTAVLGALSLQLGDFSGSLVGGAASDVAPSPGTVITVP